MGILDLFKLDGKTALVTGCRRGIGRGFAQALAEAGADIVVAHMGLTTGGDIGADTAMTLDDAVGEVQAIADAAKSVRDDVLVICHLAQPRLALVVGSPVVEAPLAPI